MALERLKFESRAEVVKRPERCLKTLEAVARTASECLAELRGSA
jgi:hypothetical protein